MTVRDAYRRDRGRLGDELRSSGKAVASLQRELDRMIGEFGELNQDRMRMIGEDRVRLVDEIDGFSKDRARLSDQNARLTQELVHLRRHPWRALIERWSGSRR